MIAIVCDGAGSSLYSDVGAEIVTETLRAHAASFISQYGAAAITPVDLREWVEMLRQRLDEQAKAQGTDARDYACTLVFVMAGENQTICGQIGDGAIIVNDGTTLNVALWPENGEYANQTFFVTQEDSHLRLQVRKFGPLQDFMLFSDGLQRLALDESQKAAYSGFYEPLVRTVRTSDALEITKEQLERFLQSDRINEKTDDDKSIIIACKRDVA